MTSSHRMIPFTGLAILASLPGASAFTASLENASLRSSSSSLTTLSMGKNAYRAHIDNVLEELYDNDWRVFRAKLVSQEQEQQEIKKETAPPSSSSSPPLHENDKLLQKQKQLSDFFAGAIGSIFKSHRNKKDADIFDGDLAGAAASMEELVPEGMIDDPFMSLSELPILIPKSQPVDKHRWAHELGHVEPGAVLIANEKLAGTFRQAVVLVVGHSEKQGTLGVVINRPLEGDVMKVASEQESKIDLSLKFAFASAPVGYGGPVATDEFFVLHGYGHVEGSQKLCPGVFIGGSQELLDVVRTNEIDPRNTLFLQGHTSWVPGQLNRELEKGVWYVASVSSSMILRYAGAPQSQPQAADYFSKGQNLWGDILHAMGGKWRDIEKEHCKANDWGK